MRIGSKGQITIPRHICDHARLFPGVEVEFVIGIDGVVRLYRKGEQPESHALDQAIARLRGRASRRLSTDELLALTRA